MISVNLRLAEILAKGYQNYTPLSKKSSSLPVNIWLDFCLHKVRFPKLNHNILPGYRGQCEITYRPTLSLFSPCKQKITRRFSFVANGSPQWVMKRFITFFHIWFFFSPPMLDYSFFSYWLSWKQASRHVTQKLIRDWVIACFGSRITTFEKWKSSGLGTWLPTPRLNISLTFPEKIIL